MKIELANMGSYYAREGFTLPDGRRVLLTVSDGRNARTTTREALLEFVGAVSLNGGNVGEIRKAMAAGTLTREPFLMPVPKVLSKAPTRAMAATVKPKAAHVAPVKAKVITAAPK